MGGTCQHILLSATQTGSRLASGDAYACYTAMRMCTKQLPCLSNKRVRQQPAAAVPVLASTQGCMLRGMST